MTADVDENDDMNPDDLMTIGSASFTLSLNESYRPLVAHANLSITTPLTPLENNRWQIVNCIKKL